MTDAEYERQKARVEALSARWDCVIATSWWHVTYVWHRETGPEVKAGRTPMMETEVRWQYQDAQIEVYLLSVAEVEDADLERILIHEYMHILLNELRPLGDWDDPREHALMHERLAHEEHAATMLAKAFLLVRGAAKADNDGGDSAESGS